MQCKKSHFNDSGIIGSTFFSDIYAKMDASQVAQNNIYPSIKLDFSFFSNIYLKKCDSCDILIENIEKESSQKDILHIMKDGIKKNGSVLFFDTSLCLLIDEFIKNEEIVIRDDKKFQIYFYINAIGFYWLKDAVDKYQKQKHITANNFAVLKKIIFNDILWKFREYIFEDYILQQYH